MSESKIGYAFFIVNEEPVPCDRGHPFETRHGANEDLSNMHNIIAFCENGLGFTWENTSPLLHSNLTLDKWDHQLANAKARKKDKCCIICKIKAIKDLHFDYFLLAISSHGNEFGETTIKFSDYKSLTISDLYMSLDKCRCLQGKPKILVLNICRTATENEAIADAKADKGVFTAVPSKRRKTDQMQSESVAEGFFNQPEVGRPVVHQPVEESAIRNPAEDFPVRQFAEECYISQPEGKGSGSHPVEERQNHSANESPLRREMDEHLMPEVGRSSVQPMGEAEMEMGMPFHLPPDYAILFPVVHGQRSKRHTTKGSWLFVELKNAVQELRQTTSSINLFHVFTLATHKIAYNYKTLTYKKDENGERVIHDGKPVIDKTHSGVKCAVEFIHSLTKPIVFDLSGSKHNV